MASIQSASKSHNRPHFLGKSYEIALNQSIEALLTSTHNSKSRESTDFASKFQELVQSKSDPPLECIWVYSSLAFTSSSTPKTEPFSRISAIKDLFQLIVSYSASCNSVKSIALVAPVIYNLHTFILEVKGFQLESKKEGKINGEIKSLVDSILGYIYLCCNGVDGNCDELEGFIRPLDDLIHFWLVDNGVQKTNVESLRAFFPLLNDEIVKRVSVEGCGMIDLSGFVVAEAFLLKLCWKIREEGFGERMRNELRPWIVGAITGLRSSYFYVTLASMLLEPVLPITSLVNVEHNDGLRKFFFDALVLAEYSFLNRESFGKLPVSHAKRVILTKLLATHEAIELFRENGDQTKAIACLNAFTSSSLPSFIIKWIKSEIGSEFSSSEPTGSSPRAFLRWMLNMENRGIKIFDDDMSKFRTEFYTKEASEQHGNEEEANKFDTDLLFYIDNKGEEEHASDEEDEKMRESMSTAFTTAARSMQTSEQGERKRKTKDGRKRKKVKSVKYDVVDSPSLPVEKYADARNGHEEGGSDVENPSSSD